MPAHSVTIRTQTVQSSGTVINTGYLKSWSGLLRFFQLALAIVCVGIVGDHFSNFYYQQVSAYAFFLIIMCTFMIGTFILLLSYLVSFSTSTIIPQTIYEFLYNLIAFGLVLSASVALLVKANKSREWRSELIIGAASCGLICSALHLISVVISYRSYKRV